MVEKWIGVLGRMRVGFGFIVRVDEQIEIDTGGVLHSRSFSMLQKSIWIFKTNTCTRSRVRRARIHSHSPDARECSGPPRRP